MDASEIIPKAYMGYLHSKLLWNGRLMSLNQWNLPKSNKPFLLPDPLPTLRLGKWVEDFAAHQIRDNLIAHSLQIRQNKQTLGELDLLFLNKMQPIHLECVYKFYLYDHTKEYKSHLEHWIGPNRSDTFMLKLDKLRHKQIPLLSHPVTETYLKKLGYRFTDFKQYVEFKAQLFLPLQQLNRPIEELNKACVRGFHCKLEDLHQFKEFEFYIPSKLEWLVIPHKDVNWFSFTEALKTIEDQCGKHRSPMIWLKDPEGNLQQAFVTWW